LTFALAGSIPTEFGKLFNLIYLYLDHNELSGTPPFAHAAWFGRAILPLAEKDLPFALAGEIPRELCQCVKLTRLKLGRNQLAGAFRQNNCFEWQWTSPLNTKRPHLRRQGRSPQNSAGSST
jgi:hypothetical protein